MNWTIWSRVRWGAPIPSRTFGPSVVQPGGTLRRRYFKQKDVVENYLTAQVRNGKMDLAEGQEEIARDWTQFLDIAQGWCSTHRCQGEP